MTPDREQWATLQELFHLAAAAPLEDRERVLEEACGDPDLRRSALEILAATEAARPQRPKPLSLPSIGPYRLVRSLGAGGTGSVYLAERTIGGTVQRSAIKVLAPHAGGAAFVERFHREQRILAGLDHPYISRMLDAGITPEGQSYLVMEYVDGEPLDIYCSENGLGIPQRIELVVKVCEAVDHAHRNLVVHLDLKPSNILVTPGATPKLLDFGTSKFVAADGRFTATLMATPAYASPEQLRHEPLTTASDIYSLGVILTEVLTGRKQSDQDSAAILIERAVARRESGRLEDLADPKDTRLRATLAGDLSNIVRKCLAPAPEERFSSVRELADDLNRYLTGMPVMARPQTRAYRFSKFVRRNLGKVALAGVLCIALTASAGYAWRQQRKAIEAGQRALRMQTFLYRLFQSANSNVTGKPAATLTEFLRLGIKVLPDYIKDPYDLRQAELGLAESMYQSRDYEGALPVLDRVMQEAKIAHDVPAEAEAMTYLCGIDYAKGLGSTGLQQCAQAVELARRPGVPARTLALAAVHSANLRAESGLIHEQPTFQLAEMAVKTSIDHHLPPHETAQALLSLANLYQNVGQLEKARGMFEQSLTYFQQDPLALCDKSDVYFGLAGITRMSGHIPESVPLYRKALDVYTTCSGPGDRETLRMGAYYAGALAESGKETEAVSFLEAAGPAWKKAFDRESPAWREYWHYLEVAYLADSRFADAERVTRTNLAFSEKWSKDASKDRIVGVENFQLAMALAKEGRKREALPYAELAERILAPTTVSEGAKKVLAQVRALEKSLQ